MCRLSRLGARCVGIENGQPRVLGINCVCLTQFLPGDTPMQLLTLFCHVDNFCQAFEPRFNARLIETGERRRRRSSRLCNSEIMTILIFFHASNYRTFKHYYLMLNQRHQAEFPNLLSYSRFVRILNKVAGPLCAYLTFCFGACTGISFIDSTRLPVCGNKRTERNRVFEDIAQLGKSSMALPFLGAKNFESDVASCEFFGLSEDKRLSQSRAPAHF